MAATRLLLVRHGETLWNCQRRMQGQGDSPLSERGQRQAAAIAERLTSWAPAALYCSDLGRALATAQPIADSTGLVPRTDPRLRERSFGVFEGLTWSEIEDRHGLTYDQYMQQPPDWAMPSGESQRDVFTRTCGVLQHIATSHPGQAVVVVTHGGTLAASFRLVTQLDLAVRRRFSILNASLNVVDYDRGAWHLVTWGDVAHEASLQQG